MVRPSPHPRALFSLKPCNPRAEEVLAHPCNKHLISWLGRKLVLNIGHIHSKSGNTTLATIGRGGDADIFVEGSSISKIQCSFEIDWDTGIVMFYDRSHSQTSQVFGQSPFPFEYGRPRKVVVQDRINTAIGFGGVNRNLVQFELKWHNTQDKMLEIVKNREYNTLGYEENPRLVQTIDEADTVLPSQRQTRIHTAGCWQPQLRYAKIDDLGSGQFGDVFKAVDVDAGKLLAVKRLRRPAGTAEQDWRVLLHDSLRREVEILSRISHPHVVDYIGSRGWEAGNVEIFMGLMEGTLQSLVEGGCSTHINDLGGTVLHHMLQALDCLAVEGIIHRDVKPENILYISRMGQYHFQLGDFGLSNHQTIATTFAGSPLFMAPEMFQSGKQTHKVDIWSLYVTMLWTLDVEGFREASKKFKTHEEVQKAVLLLASKDSVSVIQEMAKVDPQDRASAAQMLVKCFGGQGLTTPPNQVPALTSPPRPHGKSPATAAGPAPATAAQPKPRHFRRRPNPALATGQFRVEKARQAQAQVRQPFGPTKKGLGQALDRVYRLTPGGFADDNADTFAEIYRQLKHP